MIIWSIHFLNNVWFSRFKGVRRNVVVGITLAQGGRGHNGQWMARPQWGRWRWGVATITTTCCDGWVLPTAAYLAPSLYGWITPSNHTALYHRKASSHTPQEPSVWPPSQQSQERWLESVSLPPIEPTGGGAVSERERSNNGRNGQCWQGNDTLLLTFC